jgi:pantetheine-phosphate adenylyltransferase
MKMGKSIGVDANRFPWRQRYGNMGNVKKECFRSHLGPLTKEGSAVSFVVQVSGCYSAPMRTVIYPGSFDPITNGHLDVIQRAAKLFDRVVVAVAPNPAKNPLFTLEERVQMVTRAVRHLPHVEADALQGLLVEYVEKRSGQAVLRGLRAVSDFEFEFQLALMNRKLNERIETIFMMPKDTYTFLSSRIVKEIASLGGDVSAFVPAHVRTALAGKLGLAPA